MQKLFMALVALSPLVSAPTFASEEKEITAVLRGGYTTLSEVSPKGDGIGLGFDSTFAAFGDFGLGGTFYHFQSNESKKINSTLTTVDTIDYGRSFNVLAITPYYGISKGSMRANVGAIAGAMLASFTQKTRNLNDEVSVSATNAAFGFFMSANIGIAGPVFLQLKGEYIKSSGSSKIGMLNAGAGIGFYL